MSTKDFAEEVQANIEVVATLVSVLDDYTVRYMKSEYYANAAGRYVAGEMEVLLSIARSCLTDMKKTQDRLVDLLYRNGGKVQ